jgi:hypothetical protein
MMRFETRNQKAITTNILLLWLCQKAITTTWPRRSGREDVAN